MADDQYISGRFILDRRVVGRMTVLDAVDEEEVILLVWLCGGWR